MLKGAGIPSTVPRTDTTNTFTQTQTISAASALNLSSTSAALAWGSSAGANQYTIAYVAANNSISYQLGRDGSGTDHIFRNSGAIQFRLKWLGASGAVTAQLSEGVAVPAGGTTGLGYTFSSTSNLGVFFGSGAPTLSAAQGSLYIRTDGSSTSTRLYVNTNGTTGWTNVTTAT